MVVAAELCHSLSIIPPDRSSAIDHVVSTQEIQRLGFLISMNFLDHPAVMLSQLSAQCIDPHLPKMPEQPIKLAQKGSKRRRMSSKDPAKNPISNFPVHMVSETPPPRLKMAPNSQVSGSFRSGAYLTPAYSKTSTGISYSTHFITTYRDGKRKQIEVIDLTSDSNEPEDRSNSSQSTNPGDQYRGSGPLCNKRRKVESHLPLHENIPQIYDVPVR